VAAARCQDRLERALVISALLLALMGVPMAAAAGLESAARGIERAHEMNIRHPAVAESRRPTIELAAAGEPASRVRRMLLAVTGGMMILRRGV
jgi:hypothetical protein